MENFTEDDYALASRFKSARRKKRLVKKDFDKQLHTIYVRERKLFVDKRNLPLIPLENPYQQGWVRYFVLREDVLRSPNADFFQNLLLKINTYKYSNAKSFSAKVRRKGKKIIVEEHQELYRVCTNQWNCKKFGLTEKEKAYFTYVEEWSETFSRMLRYYKFNESWRYVLRVRPNIITHRKAIDEVLEQELKWIDNRITNYDLRNRINRLKIGFSRYRYYENNEKPKYSDPNKNKSLQEYYEDYVNEKIEEYGK